MINSVTIIAKFTTGTSVQNSEQAEAQVKELLLKKLKEVSILPLTEGSGVFTVEITRVKSERI